MGWDAFHRRDDLLHAVVAEADRRRDGELPLHLPGVTEAFGGEEGLVAALHLRWHTRLIGTVERELAADPSDAEYAVVAGWQRTAAHLPGVRAVLDAQAAEPASEEVRATLTRAVGRERAMLATMAHLAAPGEPQAASLGRALEELGRARAAAAAAGALPVEEPIRPVARHRQGSLMSRIKARLAA